MKAMWLLIVLNSVAAASDFRVPAPAGSLAPQLTRSQSGLVLSWLEPGAKENEFSFRWSTLTNGKWSSPRVVPSATQLFANPADRPSVFMCEDSMFAHGLGKVPGGRFAYDVILSSSNDSGSTWKDWGPIRKSRDPSKPSYDGFLSFVPEGKTARLLWIDGRDDDGKESLMSLRTAVMDPVEGVTSESVLDPDICACCRPMAVTTDEGPVFFYRGRTTDDVRDIQYVRREGSGWSKPARLHADGWKIKGCPMNGPHADARGKRVVVSWFTMGSGKAEIFSAVSKDAGASFSAPIVIDAPAEHSPRGYVQSQILDDERAVVMWVVKNASSETEIRARVISKAGEAGAPKTLVKLKSHQEMTYPQAGFASGRLILIWAQTEQAKGKTSKSVQSRQVPLKDFAPS